MAYLIHYIIMVISLSLAVVLCKTLFNKPELTWTWKVILPPLLLIGSVTVAEQMFIKYGGPQTWQLGDVHIPAATLAAILSGVFVGILGIKLILSFSVSNTIKVFFFMAVFFAICTITVFAVQILVFGKRLFP